jgi:hypothetical protein
MFGLSFPQTSCWFRDINYFLESPCQRDTNAKKRREDYMSHILRRFKNYRSHIALAIASLNGFLSSECSTAQNMVRKVSKAISVTGGGDL